MRWALLALMVLTAQPAMACMGPMAETRVLLDTLPEAAYERDVVAKVEVVSFVVDEKIKKRMAATHAQFNVPEEQRGHPPGTAILKVVGALKGVKNGDEFKVLIGEHSCSRDLNPPAIGKEAYIAGELSDGLFKGDWKRNLHKPQK